MVFLVVLLGAALSSHSSVTPITVTNYSFEDDIPAGGSHGFNDGARKNFYTSLDETDPQYKNLTAWIAQSGGDWKVSVGANNLSVPDGDRVLLLQDVSSVLNTTETSWNSLNVGDTLTLTVALGIRNITQSVWNDETFFGFTDAEFDKSDGVTLEDTVANTGYIDTNPASSKGVFEDVTLSLAVSADDVSRSGNIGILLYSADSGNGGQHANQALFDNVRLSHVAVPELSATALFSSLLVISVLLSRRRLADC